jgi:hypothetical protein
VTPTPSPSLHLIRFPLTLVFLTPYSSFSNQRSSFPTSFPSIKYSYRRY